MYDYCTCMIIVHFISFLPFFFSYLSATKDHIHEHGYPSSYLIRANIYVKFAQIEKEGFYKKGAMSHVVSHTVLPHFAN